MHWDGSAWRVVFSPSIPGRNIELYGIAAAASLVLAFALLVLTLVQLRVSRRSVDGGRDA